MPLKKLHSYLFHPDVIGNQLNQSHRMETKTLLIIRVIILLYMTTVMIINTTTEKDFMNNFLYLTLWGAFIAYAYFIFAVIENFSFIMNKKKQYFQDSLWQLTHLLFTVSFCFELPIFLMYWGYIFPSIKMPTTGAFLLTMQLHGGFFLCVMFDELINDIQFVARHIYVLVGVALVYGAVNLTYVLSSGQVIYPGMTWVNLLSFLAIIATLTLTTFAFFIGHLVYRKVKSPLMKNGDTLLDYDETPTSPTTC